MRIAMIIEAWEPIWGGGQAHVFELSKKLVRNHGYQVDIFVMNLEGETGHKQKNIEEFENGNLKIIRTGKVRDFYSLTDRSMWMFEVISKIKSSHKKENYDLIHAHANIPGIPGKILGKLLKIPIIYTIHGSGSDSMYDMYGKNIKSFFLLTIENILHRKIKYDHEISVDRQILKHENINKNISIISNGVDIEKFEKNSTGKDEEIFKIIFVGRLHPQKGLAYLLGAMQKVKNATNKKIELHIIGSGELKSSLMKKSESLGINDIVKFKGRLSGEELINEYKSSSLFVLPSLYEGQPLTLLEAWAAKLSVIATDVGDNSFFIINEKNGYLVKNKNIQALSNKILLTINNPELTRKQGLAGFDLVKNSYTWDIIAKKTNEIYSKNI